jgi:hypothetical protein
MTTNCKDVRYRQFGDNVSSWPKADMTARDSDVRFREQSGHPLRVVECLFLTQADVASITRLGVPDRFAKLHQIGSRPSPLRQ